MAKPMSVSTVALDPVTVGEDRATVRHVEARFNRFQNKNTFWRHTQNGTMAQFDRAFDDAVARLRKELGQTHPLVIDGKDVKPKATFTTKSPAEHSLVVGKWAAGTVADARKAVA